MQKEKDIFLQRFLVIFRCFMVFAILVTAVVCLIFHVGPNELWSLTIGNITGYVFSTRLKYNHVVNKGLEEVNAFDDFDGRKQKPVVDDNFSLKTI